MTTPPETNPDTKAPKTEKLLDKLFLPLFVAVLVGMGSSVDTASYRRDNA